MAKAPPPPPSSTMSADLYFAGEWRRPYNDLMEQVVGGGHKAIHDEETAKSMGFQQGAPIHGTVHWSQFTPLLLKAFGKAWFETGTISVHFKTPVSHLQPVMAFVAKPKGGPGSAEQVKIWMEHVDGRVVMEGTASCGLQKGQEVTAAEERVAAAQKKAVKGALVFQRLPLGVKSSASPARLDFDKRIGDLFPFTPSFKLDIITEWHPWFSKDFGATSPWGKAIIPPEALNQIMYYPLVQYSPTFESTVPNAVVNPEPKSELYKIYEGLPETNDSPVGLFGGCEARIVKGPIFMEHDYMVTREFVAVGETPKAEFNWEKTTLTDAATGEVVAEMLLQNMLLKASWPTYNTLRAEIDSRAAKSKL